MTSLIKLYGFPRKTPLSFVRVSGPYYNDASVGYTLFPFTYENGVLDIALTNSMSAFLNGQRPLPPPLSSMNVGITDNNVLFQLLGGNGMVTSLGPNFITYIDGWRNLDQYSSISIVIPSVMTKVQATSALNSGNAFQESSTPPSGNEYIEGNDSNGFQTFWIFKKPLTISVTEDGITSYVTFHSILY